jgi:hypothetical protein
MLKNYQNIAIDLDETLINGPHSYQLQYFVKHYNKEKTFHIVTFRTNDEFSTILTDLQNNDIDINHFNSIQTAPNDLFENHSVWLKYVDIFNRANPNKQNRIKQKNSNHDYYFEKYNNLIKWKAETCKQINAEILIDDLDRLTKVHCEKLNINFISSHKSKFIKNKYLFQI